LRLAPTRTILHNFAPFRTISQHHLSPSRTTSHHLAPPRTISHHLAPDGARRGRWRRRGRRRTEHRQNQPRSPPAVGCLQKGPTLGPSCAILDPTNWSPSWRQLGWAQSDPDGPKLEAMSCAALRSSWDPLATAPRQVGPNGDTTWGTLLHLLQAKRKTGENTSEHRCFDGFVLSRPGRPF